MSKFKIGPAKTRDGREARIYAVDGHRWEPIHGAVYEDAGWCVLSWQGDGAIDEEGDEPNPDDLMPNVEPLRAEFVAAVANYYPEPGRAALMPNEALVPFAGKRVRVTIEEILE